MIDAGWIIAGIVRRADEKKAISGLEGDRQRGLIG